VKAPDFWAENGIAPRLLQPFGLMIQAGAAIRRRVTTPHMMDIPVICVGNLVVGGAGKTPVALALASVLRQGRATVAFLSRGHGGRLDGPIKVDPSVHVAVDVGDEALLLAESAPTWVSRDRAKGAVAARAGGAGLIIMDDGFQNPGLHKTFSLVVVDGAVGFGNRRVLPAGPLREPVESGLARADGVILIGEDRTGAAASLPAELPLLRARIVPRPSNRLPAGARVLGFAGIGRPAKFHESLKELGLDVTGFQGFPDHHVFTKAEIQALLDRARVEEAIVVTTAKDHVRLPEADRSRIERLDITLNWQDEAALSALLRERTGHGPG
jgi:tetraacyldisaccharide 4'-kinase